MGQCKTWLCSLDGSKTKVFECCFNDIVITQNDHPMYVKHFLGLSYTFFTLLPLVRKARPSCSSTGEGPRCLRRRSALKLTPVIISADLTCRTAGNSCGQKQTEGTFVNGKLLRTRHLAEVVRSKQGRRTWGKAPHTPPFWAFLGLFAYPTPRG